MATGRSRALMWTGIGLCAAGALGLVVGGVLDVDAADPWASVAGGVAGLIGLALTIYALFAQRSDDGTPAISTVTASGTRSVAAGGSITTVSTGDGPTVTSTPAPPANAGSPAPTISANSTSAPHPPTPPQPRTVTASGERSIAAGGDIGSASTGNG
ncbi:hypothetical protein ACFWZJ_20935 [Streptomyces massasporeus]